MLGRTCRFAPNRFIGCRNYSAIPRNIQCPQYVCRFFDIPVFDFRNKYGGRIFGVCQIAVQMLSIDAFRNAAEDTSRLQTSGSRSVRNQDWHNAAIFRGFRGEISTKADLIAYSSGTVSCSPLWYLGSTRFTGYWELGTSSRFCQSLRYDFPQDSAYHGECRIRTNLRIDNFGREFLQYLPVLGNGFHKLGFHHNPVIRYSVVEVQDINGREHGFVSDAHPRQTSTAPHRTFDVFPFFRSPYPRACFTHEP